eukprot:scaffold132040_cov57-Phaeocystis_antarctica.AAC.4
MHHHTRGVRLPRAVCRGGKAAPPVRHVEERPALPPRLGRAAQRVARGAARGCSVGEGLVVMPRVHPRVRLCGGDAERRAVALEDRARAQPRAAAARVAARPRAACSGRSQG